MSRTVGCSRGRAGYRTGRWFFSGGSRPRHEPGRERVPGARSRRSMSSSVDASFTGSAIGSISVRTGLDTQCRTSGGAAHSSAPTVGAALERAYEHDPSALGAKPKRHARLLGGRGGLAMRRRDWIRPTERGVVSSVRRRFLPVCPADLVIQSACSNCMIWPQSGLQLQHRDDVALETV